MGTGTPDVGTASISFLAPFSFHFTPAQMPKDTCVNPLFLSLLTEWRDEVLEKNPDSYLAQTLHKAMKSLKTCKEVLVDPLVYVNISEEIYFPLHLRVYSYYRRDVQPLPYFGPAVTKGLATRYKRFMTSRREGRHSKDDLSVSVSRVSSWKTTRDEAEAASRKRDSSSKNQVIQPPGIGNCYKASIGNQNDITQGTDVVAAFNPECSLECFRRY